MFRICPDVRTGYGMTEVAGFATYTAPGDDAETVFATVGRIAPEFELRIVGPDRRELPPGEVG
ncbi:MAG: AMP-binding protein, partial [Firmicutes bacterium]|nr:AMP-binding protein [Bacillota bacterium]